ncbi:MAG: tail fiber domain-containing protein [Xanthobacteraceae bacterium]
MGDRALNRHATARNRGSAFGKTHARANLHPQRRHASVGSISRRSFARAGGVHFAGGGFRGGRGGRRSDVRLKHDITLLGRLGNGVGFYRFAYSGSDKAYVGVIAQELQAIMPEAVAQGRDGYLKVFYHKIGLRLQTYDRWIASGARIPGAAGTHY